MYSKSKDSSSDNIAELTANIVTAYVSRHDVPVQDLPSLIASVQAALGQGHKVPEAVPETRPSFASHQRPAVPIEQSIEKDHLICLEDGRKFRSLKRHLKTQYNLNPDEYRIKWGLPPEYPMVAPSYAARRSSIAKGIGLGVNVSRRSNKQEE